MNKKTHDDSMPIGEVTRVEDFLPPPSQLITKDDMRITLNLSKSTVEFFKEKAKENNVPYQPMIRAVVDNYAKHYEDYRPEA